MRILITAATALELNPIKKHIQKSKYQNLEIHFAITGIGAVQTAVNLFLLINQIKPQYIINTGIAGAYDKNFELGTVVNISTDCFADLGVLNKNNFETLFDLQFINANTRPYKNGKLKNKITLKGNTIKQLPIVTNNTVNTIHTNKKIITLLKNKYTAHIENMESAAVAYVCLQNKTPYLTLRGISNYCGERNKAKWNFELPLQNTGICLSKILSESINKI